MKTKIDNSERQPRRSSDLNEAEIRTHQGLSRPHDHSGVPLSSCAPLLSRERYTDTW